MNQFKVESDLRETLRFTCGLKAADLARLFELSETSIGYALSWKAHAIREFAHLEIRNHEIQKSGGNINDRAMIRKFERTHKKSRTLNNELRKIMTIDHVAGKFNVSSQCVSISLKEKTPQIRMYAIKHLKRARIKSAMQFYDSEKEARIAIRTKILEKKLPIYV